MNSPTGQTGRRIFTLDGSNEADSRKDVHLGGGFVDRPQSYGLYYTDLQSGRLDLYTLLCSPVPRSVVLKQEVGDARNKT